MDGPEARLPNEKILRIVGIVEDVVKLYELYKEIDMLQDMPQEIKKQFDEMSDTIELLNVLKSTSITGLVPRDYESTYTKIKRGCAYVKINDQWTRLGSATNNETISNLIQERTKILMDTLSLFEIMAMEPDDLDKGTVWVGNDAEEIVEMNKRLNEQISTKTLAIILRNITERLLFSEQDQYEALDWIYLTIKKMIEKRYKMEKNSFTDDKIIKELNAADQNYMVYNTLIKNRIFEEKLKEIDKIDFVEKDFADVLLKEIYKTMPMYYVDPDGLLDALLGEEKVGKSRRDELEAELNALSQSQKPQEEDMRQKIIKKLQENRERSKDTFYGLFEKISKQKPKQQLELLEQIGGHEIFEKMNGAVEDMLVMKKLQNQIKKMKISDEIKMKFALLTQTMELRHLLRSGIVTRSHSRDFWVIRDGVAYLKKPGTEYFGIPDEIRLGEVVKGRDIALERLATYRIEVFDSLKELVEKEIKNLNSEETAEFMECIGRRLTLNQQEQHSAIVPLIEIVWKQLKETYEEEMMKIESIQDENEKALAEDKFVLKSDRIASNVGETIKYIEEMKPLTREVDKRISAVKGEMYLFYLDAKEKNILRFREETRGYIQEVEDVNISIPAFIEDIEKGGTGPSKEQVDALFRIESVDYDKVLLKGARDMAAPLLSEMEKIIKMIGDERYDEVQKEKLEILFEVSAILILKFVMRFQIPYVLKESKGKPEIRNLNYNESVFMLEFLVHFLDLLYKWEVRAPYYEYKLETVRAIERIAVEALCPSINSIEEAYKSVRVVDILAGTNEKVKKDVMEVIGYIADKVMMIDDKKRDEKQELTKDEKIYANIVLNMASFYTSNNEYKDYADKNYGDWRYNVIEKLKSEEKIEEIVFLLLLLDKFLSEECLRTEIKSPNLRGYLLSTIQQKIIDLEKEVEGRWRENILQYLRRIKYKISLQLNNLNTSDRSEVRSFGPGSSNRENQNRKQTGNGGTGKILV